MMAMGGREGGSCWNMFDHVWTSWICYLEMFWSCCVTILDWTHQGKPQYFDHIPLYTWMFMDQERQMRLKRSPIDNQDIMIILLPQSQTHKDEQILAQNGDTVILVSNSYLIWWYCLWPVLVAQVWIKHVLTSDADISPLEFDHQDFIAATSLGTRVPRHCLLEFWIEFLAFQCFLFVDELVGKWMKMRQNSRSLCIYFTHWLMIWKILERVEIRTWMESRSVPFYWTYFVLHKYMLLKNARGSGMWVSHAGTLGSKSKWPLGLLLMRDAPRQRVASWMELVYFVEAEIGLRNQPTNLNGEPVFWHKNMYIHTYNIYIYTYAYMVDFKHILIERILGFLFALPGRVGWIGSGFGRNGNHCGHCCHAGLRQLADGFQCVALVKDHTEQGPNHRGTRGNQLEQLGW